MPSVVETYPDGQEAIQEVESELSKEVSPEQAWHCLYVFGLVPLVTVAYPEEQTSVQAEESAFRIGVAPEQDWHCFYPVEVVP